MAFAFHGQQSNPPSAPTWRPQKHPHRCTFSLPPSQQLELSKPTAGIPVNHVALHQSYESLFPKRIKQRPRWRRARTRSRLFASCKGLSKEFRKKLLTESSSSFPPIALDIISKEPRLMMQNGLHRGLICRNMASSFRHPQFNA